MPSPMTPAVTRIDTNPISLLAEWARRGITLALNAQGQLISKAAPGAIDSATATLIKTHKTALQQALAAREAFEQPLHASGASIGPLTSSQSGLWFISQQPDGLTMYNMPVHFRLFGYLDEAALHWALQALLQSEPGLRTAFRLGVHGAPEQHILPPEQCPLLYSYIDLSHLSAETQHATLQGYLSADIKTAFDLTSGQLTRVQLLRLSDAEHLLIFTQHHLISDGWSIKKLFERIRQYMRAYQAGERAWPAPAQLTFIDYARFEQSDAYRNYHQLFLPYWLHQLAGISAIHSIPTDYARPAQLSSQGQVYFSYLDTQAWQQFKQFCVQQGATAFIGVHALTALVLHQFSVEPDVVIGTPIAARDRADVDDLIGFFVNTLVLRSHYDANQSFTEFLQHILQIDLAAFDHQIQRFELLPEALQLARTPAANPLFQIMLIYQALVEFDELLPGIKGRDQLLPDLPAKTDLAIKFTETPEHVRVEWLFSTDLFSASTIASMANMANVLFAQALTAADRPLRQWRLHADQPSASHADNIAVPAPYPVQAPARQQPSHVTPLLQQLALWANTQPHQLALIDAKQARQAPVSFTYQQLYAAVLQQQQHISAQCAEIGIDPTKARIAVIGHSDARMFIRLLAMQQLAALYIPIDANQPLARQQQLLADAKPHIVLTETDADQGGMTVLDHAPLFVDTPPPDSPLYMIYTSGSTGQPKGVVVSRTAFDRLLADHQQRFNLQPQHHVINPMTFAFDAGHMAAMLALYAGSCLHLVKATELTDHLLQHSGSHLICPTALLSVLNDSQLPVSLSTIIFGGEACPVGLPQRFPQRQLFNLYGPTEATVTAFCDRLTSNASVGLGHPISHVHATIMNNHGQSCADGMPGELVLSGPQLALGYWQSATESIDRFSGGFVQGFDQTTPHLRQYRTGDMVRRHGDGNLEFLGRRDQQLKIRGYRIDPQEIQHALQSVLPELRQCHFVERQQQLIAYVVSSVTMDAVLVLRQLGQQLPPYMVPNHLIWLQQLPLTPNGKVDNAALPAPSQPLQHLSEPTAVLEIQLHQIWQQVIPGNYGIDADYFAIGGDSLRSIRLTHLIRELGLHCEVRDLFEQRTIAKLAQLLATPERQHLQLGEQGALEGDFAMLPIQQWLGLQNYADPDLFNQAILCTVPTLSTSQWQQMLEKLAAQHDVLGLQCDMWQGQQRYGQFIPQWVELTISTSDEGASLSAHDIIAQANTMQRFEFIAGKNTQSLCRAVLWRGGAAIMSQATRQSSTEKIMPAQGDLLMLCCHHLIIDALSWPILLGDLQRLTQQQTLAAKGLSYRQWGDILQRYQQQHPQQLGFYRQLCQSAQPYLATIAAQPQAPAELCLDETSTRQLLAPWHANLGTDAADLMLVAIARTLAQLGVGQQLLIGLESHGRHDITLPDRQGNWVPHNVNHSVGWFSSLMPLVLDTELRFADLLTSSKDQRRLLPDHGIGFLGFATQQPEQLPLPAVILNYHGVISTPANTSDRHFTPLELPSPLQSISPANQHQQLLSLHGAVHQGQLKLRQIGSIEGIANHTIMTLLQQQLIAVIAEAKLLALGGSRLSRGDMPYTATDNQELRRLQQQYPIETVINMTALQQSMLALHLRDPADRAYHQQIQLRYSGSFAVKTYAEAWQAQTRRFPALRSCLYWQQQPLELILSQTTIPIQHLVYQGEPDQVSLWVNQRATAQLDAGVRLDQAPLCRIEILTLENCEHIVLCLLHHAITDGWSMPNLLQSVHQHYAQLQSQIAEQFPVDQAYIPYRRLLEQQQPQTDAYWQQQLQQPHPGYPLSTLLARDLRQPTRRHRQELAISVQFTAQEQQGLQQFCQHQGITSSILGLYSWHSVLREMGRHDVTCCGYVVAGRDLPVHGLTQSVGLFNNVVPLLLDWSNIADDQTGLQRMQQLLLAANRLPNCQFLRWQSRNHAWFESVFLFENYPTPGDENTSTRQTTGDTTTTDVTPHRSHDKLAPTLAAAPHEPVELPLGVSMAIIDGCSQFNLYVDPTQIPAIDAQALVQRWVARVRQLIQSAAHHTAPALLPSLQLAMPRASTNNKLALQKRPLYQTPAQRQPEEQGLTEPPELQELLQLLPPQLAIKAAHADQAWHSLGLTSLHLVLWRQRIMQHFQRHIPSSIFEQHQTLWQLTRWLRQQHRTPMTTVETNDE